MISISLRNLRTRHSTPCITRQLNLTEPPYIALPVKCTTLSHWCRCTHTDSIICLLSPYLPEWVKCLLNISPLFSFPSSTSIICGQITSQSSHLHTLITPRCKQPADSLVGCFQHFSLLRSFHPSATVFYTPLYPSTHSGRLMLSFPTCPSSTISPGLTPALAILSHLFQTKLTFVQNPIILTSQVFHTPLNWKQSLLSLLQFQPTSDIVWRLIIEGPWILPFSM
jgi:hypothetical protein